MQRLSIFSRADRGGSIYYMYRKTLKSSPLTIKLSYIANIYFSALNIINNYVHFYY